MSLGGRLSAAGCRVELHGRCIEHRLGHVVDAWAFVPSVRIDRIGKHPLHVVAQRAGLALPEIELVTDERADPEQRATSADRFALAVNSPVQDRHILLIEDTWVSGGNAQSATLTLRGGKVASVTITGPMITSRQQPTLTLWNIDTRSYHWHVRATE